MAPPGAFEGKLNQLFGQLGSAAAAAAAFCCTSSVLGDYCVASKRGTARPADRPVGNTAASPRVYRSEIDNANDHIIQAKDSSYESFALLVVMSPHAIDIGTRHWLAGSVDEKNKNKVRV